MGELIPLEHKTLKKIPELIEKHRDETGKINIEKFMDEFHKIFGKYGGEYWTNAHERISRTVLLPVAAPSFSEAQVADAQIYFPDNQLKEGINAVKEALREETKVKTVAVGGGKPLQYIPYYQKIIEALIRAHNELVDEFGDRFILLALRGGMAARNAATVPVKVREKERLFGGDWDKPKIRTYIGTIPDVDPFVVIRNATWEDRTRAASILKKHLEAAGIPPALLDIRHEDGIVSDRDYEALAHSLHTLKPILVVKGAEFIQTISKHPEFRKYQTQEAMMYWNKIDELDKRWFGGLLRPTMKMLGLLAIEDEDSARRVLKYIRAFLEQRFRINKSTKTGKKVYDRTVGTMNMVLRWKKEGTLEEKLKHDYDMRMVNELTKDSKRLYRAIQFAIANDPEAKEMYIVLKSALDLSKVPPEHKKRITAAFALGVLRGRETVGRYLQEGMGMDQAEKMGFAKIPKNIQILRRKEQG